MAGDNSDSGGGRSGGSDRGGWRKGVLAGAVGLFGVLVYNALVPAAETMGDVAGRSFDSYVRDTLGLAVAKPPAPPAAVPPPAAGAPAPTVAAGAPALPLSVAGPVGSTLVEPVRAAVTAGPGRAGPGAVRRLDVAVGAPEPSGAQTAVTVVWRATGPSASVDCEERFRYHDTAELGRMVANRIGLTVATGEHGGTLRCG